MGSALSPQIAAAEQSSTQANYRVHVLLDGFVGGLLGALAIAMSFLLVDLSEGRPLSTPAVLSALLFRVLTSTSPPALGAAAIYTGLHFGAFGLLGLAVAWLVRTTKRVSMVALLVTVFIAASEVFFVLLLADNEGLLVPAVSRWSVLVANLVGVSVMLAYFFARNPSLGGSLLGSWVEVVSEGILAGLIGGLVVAIWFFLFDVSSGQPFQTPAMLGAALVGNQGTAAMASMSPELIFIYTGLHFAAFMLFGVMVAGLLASFKRAEMLVAGLFLLFLLFEFFFVGLMTMIDEEMLSALRRWKIEVGNLLASAVVLSFLLARNREMRARLLHGWKTFQEEVLGHMVPKPPEGR